MTRFCEFECNVSDRGCWSVAVWRILKPHRSLKSLLSDLYFSHLYHISSNKYQPFHLMYSAPLNHCLEFNKQQICSFHSPHRLVHWSWSFLNNSILPTFNLNSLIFYSIIYALMLQWAMFQLPDSTYCLKLVLVLLALVVNVKGKLCARRALQWSCWLQAPVMHAVD